MSDRTTSVPATTEREPAPPPAHRGRLGVASVALGSFAIVLSEFLPVGLLPAIASGLDVPVGSAGLMVVVTGLLAAVAAPAVTVAASGLDRRVVLTGLGAANPGFAEIVGATVGLPTHLLPPPDTGRRHQPSDAELAVSYGLCLGVPA